MPISLARDAAHTHSMAPTTRAQCCTSLQNLSSGAVHPTLLLSLHRWETTDYAWRRFQSWLVATNDTPADLLHANSCACTKSCDCVGTISLCHRTHPVVQRTMTGQERTRGPPPQRTGAEQRWSTPRRRAPPAQQFPPPPLCGWGAPQKSRPPGMPPPAAGCSTPLGSPLRRCNSHSTANLLSMRPGHEVWLAVLSEHLLKRSRGVNTANKYKSLAGEQLHLLSSAMGDTD